MPWMQFTGEQVATLKKISRGEPVHHDDRMAIANAIEEKERNVGDPRYLAYAQENLGSDGDIEFDDEAVVSEGSDPGAYVMGWKWVYASDAGVPLEEKEEA